MTLQLPVARDTDAPSVIPPARLASGWLVRTLVVLLAFWTAAVVVPQLLDLGGAWRAFAAGLVVPGAGILYAIPAMHHPFPIAMVVGHAVVIALELLAVAWVLRRFRLFAAVVAALGLGALAFGCVVAPSAVVVAGHVAGFVGVLVACGWAFGARLLSQADSVTPVAIIVVSAVVGASLTSVHGDMPGPLTWVPWAALAVAVLTTAGAGVRAQLRRRTDRRIGQERLQYLSERRAAQTPPVHTGAVSLDVSSSTPQASEAREDELRLLRYLLSLASQPADNWDGFNHPSHNLIGQYRYQVNALGWALATYNYSHTPSFAGVLSAAQLALIERAQQKAVWGYWYWQNLLGNWDLIKRRADPVDVPQNIMFSGFLNLQLGMYRQATGDDRFDTPGSLVFEWSPRQRFSFDHQKINNIAIRNFNQDICLWPCEPILSPGRKRGFVFPYCNTVTTASIAIMDTVNGTAFAPEIARSVETVLNQEYTSAANDLAAFIVSGLGLSVRSFIKGPTTTAAVVAFFAPLCPELTWRTWQILEREWLQSGRYREPNSAGNELMDWGTGAKTNAEPLAAAMLLAAICGETQWHTELWNTALDQLRFSEDSVNPGVWSFADASVHGNGMLGFAGLGRPFAFNDMLTRPRPTAWQTGPRLADAPHPDVLVAKAVSDGEALDIVVYPGDRGARVRLRVDQLRPNRRYTVHGAVDPDITADAAGTAEVTVDVAGRTTIEIRPG